MLGWFVSIVISYILFIITFKLDDKYNNGDFRDNIEDVWGILIFCIIAPFVNIILGLLLIGAIVYTLINDKIEGKGIDAEDIIKKIFFIKEKK